MPALKPPPRQQPARLTEGKDHCPRCGHKLLNPSTLRCFCSAEFTAAGLEHFRALPAAQALRS